MTLLDTDGATNIANKLSSQNGFNGNNLKKPMNNVELEKYYREQYYRYPYNCFPKQIAFERYQHYMKLNIEENLNGITRCGRY